MRNYFYTPSLFPFIYLHSLPFPFPSFRCFLFSSLDTHTSHINTANIHLFISPPLHFPSRPSIQPLPVPPFTHLPIHHLSVLLPRLVPTSLTTYCKPHVHHHITLFIFSKSDSGRKDPHIPVTKSVVIVNSHKHVTRCYWCCLRWR